jgi:hypothetical protein
LQAKFQADAEVVRLFLQGDARFLARKRLWPFGGAKKSEDAHRV